MEISNHGTTSLSRLLRWIEQRNTWLPILVAVLLDVLIGLLDFLTGYQIAFSVFYLLPVTLVSRSSGRIEGILISVLCAITWLPADLATDHVYAHSADTILERLDKTCLLLDCRHYTDSNALLHGITGGTFANRSPD